MTLPPARNCTPLSCCQSARLAPRDCGAHDEGIDGFVSIHDDIKVVLHLCKSTQYGLEGPLCSSQHIPADVDLEGKYDDLARPSSIGRASELSILTCRISEQHCCMEIDSVSRFTEFREFVFSHVELWFFFSLVLC